MGVQRLASTVRSMFDEKGLRMTNAETQLASFFAKYEPAIGQARKSVAREAA